MPRIPSAFDHRAIIAHHHDALHPYHSYHYNNSSSLSSSPQSSPPPPNASSRTAKSGDFTTPGGLFPYQKGKKVSNDQLSALLDYFQENDNPCPARRVVVANQLQMSVKAVSIWFQNERANVKKGRSRAAELAAAGIPESVVPAYFSSRRPRTMIVAPLPRPVTNGRIPTPRPVNQDAEDSTSVYSEDSEDESDETIELESPQSEVSHLPRVRVALPGEEEPRLDMEGMLVAQILVDMKFSKL